MARTRWILLAALMALATTTRAAEPQGAGTTPAPSPPGATLGDGNETTGGGNEGLVGAAVESEASATTPAPDEPKIDLSLADAMALAIQNNLDVQIARHDPLIAWERTRIARGVYDPEAFTEITRSTVETPIASFLQATNAIRDEFWNNEGGLRGTLPALSTEYQVSFAGNRTRTDRTIASLSEQWESALTFSVTQPLLRGLYWNEPWTEVKLSREAYGEALENFRKELMDVVQAVENAYWAAVSTDEQERVAVKSLEAARELLDQTQVQYEVGVVSKVEVFESEAGVAERDVDLIEARNAYRSAQDQLIDAIYGANLRPGSHTLVNPTDRPGDYTAYTVDVEAAADKAMERRPELSALAEGIRQQEIQLTFNRNQMAPQLDVVASYGFQGLAGKPCKPTPAGGTFGCTPAAAAALGMTIDKDFGSSLKDYFKSRGASNWSVGGVFSIPLGNHAARARKRQAEIQLRKIRTQRARLVQDIILGIRQSARDLHTAQQRIEAAERRRLAAEEQFRAEGIRLEQGESTPFDVLLRERDLVDAESQKIEAFRRYRIAVAALERAQGTILDRHNLVVDDARRLR